MTIHQSAHAKGNASVPYPANAGIVTAHRATFTVPTTIALSDIVELCCIPPGCRPVDAIFDTDDLDSATAIVWDIGIMSGAWGSTDNARTCGDELFDGITTSQTGGLARPSLAKSARVSVSNSERSIGAKLMTAAGTPVAGTIGLTVFYVAD